jgi:hypothetical protein
MTRAEGPGIGDGSGQSAEPRSAGTSLTFPQLSERPGSNLSGEVLKDESRWLRINQIAALLGDAAETPLARPGETVRQEVAMLELILLTWVLVLGVIGLTAVFEPFLSRGELAGGFGEAAIGATLCIAVLVFGALKAGLMQP